MLKRELDQKDTSNHSLQSRIAMLNKILRTVEVKNVCHLVMNVF